MKKPDPIEFTIPDTNTTITLIHLPVKEKVNGVYQITGWKPYMEVSQRLVWFNLVASDHVIETEIDREWSIVVENKPIDLIRFKATLKDPAGKVLRTARKTKEISSEKDYETCETGAVGRVMAYWGVGTQYATQDIEDDVADAPTHLKGKENEGTKAAQGDRLTGNTTSTNLQTNKTTTVNKAGNSTAKSNDGMDKPFDSELANIGKKKFGVGVNALKTFEEFFKEELTAGHKWAKARMKELNEGREIPEVAIQYLDYVETLGVNL